MAKRTKKPTVAEKKAKARKDAVQADEPKKEEKFVPQTVTIEGVEKPLLDEVHLLKLELIHAKIQANAQSYKATSLDAEKTEHEMILKVRKLRQQAGIFEQLSHSLNDEKMRLLGELSELYGVDFKHPETTYNSDTRIITVPVVPFKREDQKKALAEEADKKPEQPEGESEQTAPPKEGG